ncbi:hypothetical protein L4X63_03120 [Geomonas sp. Red32]|uniref:Nmad2 family putative nucleotide modification protein n=1 Tax=Geomonas sp. Red32 TaxID=2912856 RepID=UPI00202CCC2F|nr:hypothetical protein [Geomonas sp. Red32]MCM0080574.1 hypothetical protein [Geomonas sp. Red32]
MDNKLYIYVVDRDFGFAPNPFHGYCTLATCKPRIRRSAKAGDWIMGVGGGRLKATGRCIYLMKVCEVITFNDYWTDSRFELKKPVRNGSKVMMVGDNIYHQEAGSPNWIQEDSHHSLVDGSPNVINVIKDTSSLNVLISEHFYYFGKSAPVVDLDVVCYKNRIDHDERLLGSENVNRFIIDMENKYKNLKNFILDLPFNFTTAHKRADQATGKVI